jgi:hypothetical protein
MRTVASGDEVRIDVTDGPKKIIIRVRSNQSVLVIRDHVEYDITHFAALHKAFSAACGALRVRGGSEEADRLCAELDKAIAR